MSSLNETERPEMDMASECSAEGRLREMKKNHKLTRFVVNENFADK